MTVSHSSTPNICSLQSPSTPPVFSNLDDHNYCLPSGDFLNLRFLSLNVCGLLSKIKYGNFEQYIKDFDFICLSETKANYIADDEFSGFNSFFSPKKVQNKRSKKSPELAILVNEKVKKFTKIIENTSSDWILWLMVGENSENIEFILGCTYIPCEGSTYHNDHIFDDIADDILSFQADFDVPLILMGDFNARTATKNDFTHFDNDITVDNVFQDESNSLKELNLQNRYSNDKVTNLNGNLLLELCKSFDLRILNGRFGDDKNVGDFTCHTSQGKSVVDYIITSDCLLPHVIDFKVDVFDKCLSDVHSPLCLSMRKEIKVVTEKTSNVIPSTIDSGKTFKNFRCKWKPGIEKDFISNFSEPDIEILSSNIHNTDQTDCSTEKIDSLVGELSDLFIKTAQSIGLCKESVKQNKKYIRKYPNKPWWNNECEVAREHYFEFVNKLKAARTPAQKRLCRKTLDLEFKQYKKFLGQRQYRFRIEVQEKLKNLKNRDPKAYRKLIDSATTSPKRREGDITLSSFLEHFKKLGESPPSENNFDPRVIQHSISEDLNSDFTFDEIKKVIKKLKNNKASGIDNISNEFLKNCPDTVVIVIVDIFNLVLKTGIIPTDWTIGIIQPIFKNKGSINNPDNYRGITLLSCIGKLFTACIYHRLSLFFDNRVVLGEEQAGFRSGYSTNDHSFVLNFIIDFYKQLGIPLYCAFIDYKKAFDLINRAILWQKLISEHVNGNIIRILYNLYDQAKSCVKKGGKISDFFKCNAGVRQGENLSPFLFAVYLNDFERFLRKYYFGLTHVSIAVKRELSDNDIELYVKLFVLLYADDTIVLAESELELQAALNAVSVYCKDNDLTVSLTKTKVIIFSSGRITKHRDFIFNNKPVEVVDDYIYLGTTFNFNGNFSKAMQKQTDLAQKAMYSLLTKARRLLLPIDLQIELFEQTVLPILLYGSEIWGHLNIQCIEIFYRKFLKIVLKLSFSTPSCQVYGEAGRPPIKNLINRRIISFWIKISEDKPMKFATLFYNLMYKLHVSGQFYFSWVENVKNILYSCNFQNLWDHQHDYATKQFLKSSIYKALDDIYVESWKHEIFTNQYTTIYRMYKEDFCIEKYLSLPKLTSYQRFSLVKFRCGSNKLPINKFKFSRISQDKLCPFCTGTEFGFYIGNEFHFLFECTTFTQERQTYLKRYYYTHPNTVKIKQLFNSLNIKTLRNLAKFASCIMKKFH